MCATHTRLFHRATTVLHQKDAMISRVLGAPVNVTLRLPGTSKKTLWSQDSWPWAVPVAICGELQVGKQLLRRLHVAYSAQRLVRSWDSHWGHL